MLRLRRVLKVQPGEDRKVVLVVGIALTTFAGAAVGTPGVEGLFFARFGVEFLPYLYMALGLLTMATSLTISAVLGRLPRRSLYQGMPLALAAVLLVGWALVRQDLSWVYPALWLAMNLMWLLQALLLWGLAGAVCDTRQAKRLFPVFSAGAILGIAIGGLVTPTLVELIGTANLLLLWAGLLIAASALTRLLSTELADPPSRARRRTRLTQNLQAGLNYVRRSEFMRWKSASAVLFSVLFFSLAFPFSRAVASQFPGEDEIAGFLGILQGAITGTAFLVSLLLANRLYARFGFMSAILAFPALYLVGFGVVAVRQAFMAVVAFRFVQMVYLQGVASTAYQATFNVVPSERRDQTRTFIDGVPGQAGVFLTGLVLVVAGSGLRDQQLFLLGIGASGLTLFTVWNARRAYRGALVQALQTGQPQVFFDEDRPFGGFQRDAASVQVALEGISNPDASIRRVAAEVLGSLSTSRAVDALVEALRDPVPEVRKTALRALASRQATAAILEVATCLHDPESEVRRQVVDTVQALVRYPQGLIAQLEPLLEDPEAAVRAGAAAAILAHGPHAQAEAIIMQMATTRDLETRLQAYAAMANWGDPDCFEPAAAGLEDPAAAVRQAAARTLPFLDPQRAIAPLIQALGDRDEHVRDSAAQALGRIGSPALEPAVAALAEPGLEAGALLALAHLPTRPVENQIMAYSQDRIEQAVHYHGISLQVGQLDGSERMHLLEDSVQALAHQQGIHALRAFALVSEGESLALAIDNLDSRQPEQRANALEVLDTSPYAREIQPLVRLWEPALDESPPVDGWLQILLADEDPWVRACTAMAAIDHPEPAVLDLLKKMGESDPDALVRQTALAVLDRSNGMDTLQTLSLMDRILFLRRVPLFADLTPVDLKYVASLVEEQLFPPGEVLCEQGDPGDELFIIVSGEIQVRASISGRPEVEIARRRTGEYVGEMAIITQEPRMATLETVDEVRLLCLDRKRFEAILRERPETSLAVMRVLCNRLKEDHWSARLRDNPTHSTVERE